MKRFITKLFLFFFAQISCYAVEDCQPDSIESGFRVFGNDTLVTVNYENFISRGLAQYIDDSPVYYGHIDCDVIHYEGNDYIHRNMSNFIQDIIEGYGKERCREMFELFSKSEKDLRISIRVRINLEGKITCVKFWYSSEFNSFMTYEDIKRNTKIITNRKPDPYLAKYGIELSPWITFPIPVTALQKHLYQVTDHKYNGKTIRFDYRQNSMVCGYVKEQRNDSIVFNSNESSKNKYLKDKDVTVNVVSKSSSSTSITLVGSTSDRIFFSSTSISTTLSSIIVCGSISIKSGVVRSGVLPEDDFRNLLRSPASPISDPPPPIAV
jgi:hypothetical protein